jgi:hypothetical protein
MSNLYRGPSIDASYQVSVHLAKWFQRRRFKKSANQKQELPVVAYLLMDRLDVSDFNFLAFLAHLAKGNVSFCHHLASVNFSHFNLLL